MKQLLYSVLRYVPDPARGEFVNVGLIVGSERTGECKVALDATRRWANSIGDRDTVHELWRYLGEFKAGLEQQRGQWHDYRFSQAWLNEQWGAASNLLQLSQPTPYAGADLLDAVERLSDEFLHAPPTRTQATHIRKSSLVAEMRKVYRSTGFERGKHFFEKPVISGPHHQEIFDFAVANGRAVQLTHAWNFRQHNLAQLAESVKAWAFTVEEIRDSGGEGSLGSKTFTVPKKVAVGALYIAPSTKAGRATLTEARHACRRVDAKLIPQSGVQELANRAATLLKV